MFDIQTAGFPPYTTVSLKSSKNIDGRFILESELGEIELDEMGGCFWQILSGEGDVDSKILKITDEYGVSSEQVYQDLVCFAFKLSEKGLLNWQSNFSLIQPYIH